MNTYEMYKSQVMGSLLVISAVVIHFIMPGIRKKIFFTESDQKQVNILCLDIPEVPQPPADGDKPGMCAALQKPGILVALFKVLVAIHCVLVELCLFSGEHCSLQCGVHPDHIGAPPCHLEPPSYISPGNFLTFSHY